MPTEIVGAKRLEATLHAAADDVAASLAGPNEASASALAAKSRANAPRRSGRLAGSLEAASGPEGFDVHSDLVYAPVHEFGWSARGIRAARFVGRAFDSERDPIVDRTLGEVRRVLGRVKGA